MKTKLFIFGILAAALLASCTPPPSENHVKSYLDEVKLYYPYSTDENFVFVNEDLGLTWEAMAYDDNQGVYPYVEMDIVDEVLAKSYGDWNVFILALMQEDGMIPEINDMSQLITYISGETKNAHTEWYFRIRLSEEETYSGKRFGETSTIGDFSIFKDTIMIPIEYESHYNKKSDAPAGAYARIVKRQGLTDFSTDGKTVWRRVK